MIKKTILEKEITPPIFPKRFRRIRRHGTVVMIYALVTAILVGSIAFSIAKTNSIAFTSKTANNTALQAQQYAASKMSRLAMENFEDINAQKRTAVEKTGFEDRVVVSDVVDEGDGIASKNVVVEVFKPDDKMARATVSRKFYTKKKGGDKVFGDPIEIAVSGSYAAPATGFLCAGGSWKGGSMNIKIDGKTLGFVVGRDYGSGTITACVPVNKGQTITISGCYWAYLVPMNT